MFTAPYAAVRNNLNDRVGKDINTDAQYKAFRDRVTLPNPIIFRALDSFWAFYKSHSNKKIVSKPLLRVVKKPPFGGYRKIQTGVKAVTYNINLPTDYLSKNPLLSTPDYARGLNDFKSKLGNKISSQADYARYISTQTSPLMRTALGKLWALYANSAVASSTNQGAEAPTTNQMLFYRWVKGFSPKLYGAAMAKSGGGGYAATNNLGGIWDSVTGFFSNFGSALTSLAPTYLKYRQQRDLMKAQLARAKAGQPPLTPSQYSGVLTSPKPYQTALPVPAKSSYAMPLIIGGAALLAIMLLKK